MGAFRRARGALLAVVAVCLAGGAALGGNLDLTWSTLLGGGGSDYCQAVALDDSLNVYVAGYTSSSDFPATAGAYQTTYDSGVYDAFVAKLNTAGSALVYCSYIGSTGVDQAYGIAVDGSGNAYVTGHTLSFDFPATTGAYDTTTDGSGDVFVAKLNAAGSALAYATLLGGSDTESGYGIAIDGSGNAYVTGFTASNDFPTTAGAFQTSYGDWDDAFVTKLNAAGTALVYSTFLGGSDEDQANAIAVDTSGHAYVTGYTLWFDFFSSSDFPTTVGAYDRTLDDWEEVFVTQFNAAGTALVYSTFIGGDDDERGHSIAIDSSGNAHITGTTFSANFPTTPGALDSTVGGYQDAFVAKLNSAGSALVYSTLLGGDFSEQGYGIAVGQAGAACVTGYTSSQFFPWTLDAFDSSHNGIDDAFVVKLNPAGTALLYATFLGGLGLDYGHGIVVDGAGGTYVAGSTSVSGFPVTPGAFDTTLDGNVDGFVTKFVVGIHRCVGFDANSDSQITFDDIGVFSGAYGSSSGDANWRPGCDYNQNGIVDFGDISAFSGCYGSSW